LNLSLLLFLSFFIFLSVSAFHSLESKESLPLTPQHIAMPSKEDSPLEEANLPLLEDERDDEQNQKLAPRFWIESKKLWHIVGPSILSRVLSYSMLVITQAFAGRLGDLELAAISIANNVVVGFDFGLLVCFTIKFQLLQFSSKPHTKY